MTSDELISAIRSRGSDTTDLRDGVHEAHHAIEAGVPEGKWDRDTISRYVKRMGRGRAAASEIVARAVEQIICAKLGVETKPISHWAMISCMEAIKFREAFMDYTEAVNAIESAMKQRRTLEAVDKVLALVSQPQLTKSKRTKKAK